MFLLFLLVFKPDNEKKFIILGKKNLQKNENP